MRKQAAAALALAASAALAQPAPVEPAHEISLRSVRIDVRAGEPALPHAMRAALDDPDRSETFLVKWAAPVTAEQERVLRTLADAVYTYLPHYTWLVRMPAARANEEARRSLGAAWIGPYHPAYKVSPEAAAVVPAPGAEVLAPVMVWVFPDADLGAAREGMRRLGARVAGSGKSGTFARVRLLLTQTELATLRDHLARMPEVFWIEPESRRVLLNDTTIWVGQSGTTGGMATPIFAHGIHGEGQVVGIIDTGIDPDMCFFRDTVRGLPPQNACTGSTTIDALQRKVLAVDFLWTTECTGGIGVTEWDTQNHGTHVAGTVAGDNFASPITHDTADGMAPAAKLVIQDGGYMVDNCADCPGLGCPVVDLNPLFQQAYDQGARLHTNSWGDQENANPQNNYTAGSQDADEFMWNHKDFLLFFAAGNSGPGTASVGSPSTAKSVVSVGATLRGASAESMASFSSCGPTDDGRIKPELTIPGSSIVSAGNDFNATTNNCGTRTMSGTSMASPAAAGLAALVRQYFVDGWYPSGAAVPADAFTPSAALVRAGLVNSAQSMTGVAAIPSNCQGWGRIRLDRTLVFSGGARKLWVKDDATGFPNGSSNESRTFTFTVNGSAEPFKATLAWTDYPSTPAASPHLNNDLDLVVTGPGGTYRGNVFSSGQSATGGSADRLNTLEQVLLASPAPGTYTVTARSFNVPNGPQPFALVVTGDVTPVVTTGRFFYTLTPCRVLDTRNPDGPLGGPAIAGGAAPRTFAVAGTCGIPPTAQAIAVNVTATQSTGPGHVSVFAAGGTDGGTSLLNFAAGQTRANNGLLSLGASGISIASGAAPGIATHVLLDVVGYFQ